MAAVKKEIDAKNKFRLKRIPSGNSTRSSEQKQLIENWSREIKLISAGVYSDRDQVISALAKLIVERQSVEPAEEEEIRDFLALMLKTDPGALGLLDSMHNK